MDPNKQTPPAPPAATPPAGPGPADTKPAEPGATPPATPAAPAVENVQVPLTVVKALQDELKAAKENIALYQAQQAMSQPVPGQVAPAKPAEPAVEPFADLKDEDLLTVADAKKALTAVQPAGVDPVLAGRLAKIEVQLTDPNYETTIRQYLPGIVTTNPAIWPAIQQAPNPILAALQFARTNPQYIAAQQAAATPPAAGGGTPPAEPGVVPLAAGDLDSQINAILANAAKPGNPGTGGQTGVLDAANQWATMPDDEFEKKLAGVISGTQ